MSQRCQLHEMRSYNIAEFNTSSSHSSVDLDFLQGKKISKYWLHELSKLTKPAAKMLIPQLNGDTPLGYEPITGPAKKGTLLDFTIQQKYEHEDKVILMRSGEFYETYGIDALMLINYCGLNAMGNKCKAGCPVKNIQSTLDGLTSAGLSCAVYEEINDVDSNRGPLNPITKGKIKHRILSQIISPAFTTYAYDLCLRYDDQVDYRENKPIVGIVRSVHGFQVCHVWLDEKLIIENDRLTSEAVRLLVEQYGYVEPVFVCDLTMKNTKSTSGLVYDSLSFLSNQEQITSIDSRSFTSQLLRKISRRFEVNLDEFRMFSVPSIGRPRSIYTSTALQIGLLSNPNVPDLISRIVPKTHGSQSVRFFRHWLLNPPTYEIADHMHQLCYHLQYMKEPLPDMSPVPVGKIVSLLHLKQLNVGMIREIRNTVSGLMYMLSRAHESESIISESATEMDMGKEAVVDIHVELSMHSANLSGKSVDVSSISSTYQDIVRHMLPIVSVEASGIQMNETMLLNNCKRVLSLINSVVVSDEHDILAAENHPNHNKHKHNSDNVPKDPYGKIPDDFFYRNENEFRNKVLPTIPIIQALYTELEAAKDVLVDAVNQEFPDDCEIVFDIFNNAIMMREQPTKTTSKTKQTMTAAAAAVASLSSVATSIPLDPVDNNDKNNKETTNAIKYIQPTDRRGLVIPKRYTTKKVQEALMKYQQLTAKAPIIVTKVIQVCNKCFLFRYFFVAQHHFMYLC